MSDDPGAPLLGNSGADKNERQRPDSQRSTHSAGSDRSKRSVRSSAHSEESTPLLSRNVNHGNYGDAPDQQTATSSLRSLQEGGSKKEKNPKRWPTIIALTVLTLVVLAILGLGFAAPEVAEQYAKEAMVFEPAALSIDSFTASGVRARVQGDFTMDASKVPKKPVRDLGRFGTWVARAVESKPTRVEVYLPEYGNILLGTAEIPSIVVDIRNGHTTHLDFVSDLTAGDLAGVRRVANDWLEGRLSQLAVRANANVPIKSGIFGFGTQRLSESVVFKGMWTYLTCELYTVLTTL